MADQQAPIEAFLAQMNGTIEALVLAFGGLIATHPNPERPMALLQSMLDAASAGQDGKEPNAAAAAYAAGTRAAVTKLAAAAKLAREVQAMEQAGPTQ
jgi:hypothetical protein